MIISVNCLGQNPDTKYFEFNALHDQPCPHPEDIPPRLMVSRVSISPDFKSFRSVGYRPVMTPQLRQLFRDELRYFLLQRI